MFQAEHQGIPNAAGEKVAGLEQSMDMSGMYDALFSVLPVLES